MPLNNIQKLYQFVIYTKTVLFFSIIWESSEELLKMKGSKYVSTHGIPVHKSHSRPVYFTQITYAHFFLDGYSNPES